MKKEFVSLIVVVTIVGLLSSAALALDPLGPPVAGCKQDQFSAGFEFAFGDMDLEVSGPGISTSNNNEAVLKDVQSRKYFARIGYGISDDWEIFTRLGVTDIEFEADASSSQDFDSDHEFAFGVGTKKTFVDNGDVKWGAIFQFSWAEVDDRFNSASVSFANGGISKSYVQKIELDWYEMQLAIGPQWMIDEGIYIYGGPFLHFLEGDLDVITAGGDTRYEHELEQESEFGGFGGCVVEIDEHLVALVEGQIMSDAWLVALGVTWLF